MYNYLKDIDEVRRLWLQEPLTRSATILYDVDIDFSNDNLARQPSWGSNLDDNVIVDDDNNNDDVQGEKFIGTDNAVVADAMLSTKRNMKKRKEIPE